MSTNDPTRLLFTGREWASALYACCDFPAASVDGEGRVCLATTAVVGGHRLLRLHGLNPKGGGVTRVLVVPEATGVGVPAVGGLGAGGVTVCPVERAGRWRIAGFFRRTGDPVFLDAGGTVNDQPAVAVAGSVVHVVWQSNAGGTRAIYATPVAPSGGGAIVRLSSAPWHSQNPALVSIGDSELFAAWDSIRDDSADIHGARFRDGAWLAGRRLTSDKRIERHASLATWDGAVWMAWQAQSYPDRLVNRLEEQRIVVARLDDDGPQTLLGGMESLSPAQDRLLRPRIVFDPAGRLWLSYRRSLGTQHGWAPQIRVFDGNAWSRNQDADAAYRPLAAGGHATAGGPRPVGGPVRRSAGDVGRAGHLAGVAVVDRSGRAAAASGCGPGDLADRSPDDAEDGLRSRPETRTVRGRTARTAGRGGRFTPDTSLGRPARPHRSARLPPRHEPARPGPVPGRARYRGAGFLCADGPRVQHGPVAVGLQRRADPPAPRSGPVPTTAAGRARPACGRRPGRARPSSRLSGRGTPLERPGPRCPCCSGAAAG